LLSRLREISGTTSPVHQFRARAPWTRKGISPMATGAAGADASSPARSRPHRRRRGVRPPHEHLPVGADRTEPRPRRGVQPPHGHFPGRRRPQGAPPRRRVAIAPAPPCSLGAARRERAPCGAAGTSSPARCSVSIATAQACLGAVAASFVAATSARLLTEN